MKEQSPSQEEAVQKKASQEGVQLKGDELEGGSPEKSKGIMYYIHIAIGLSIMFGFGHLLEPFGELTRMGMQIVGVFLGAIYLWTIVSIIWPSILGLVALSFTDYYPNIAAVVRDGFGDNIVVALLFVMILFGVLDHLGVTNYIARWFLTRKVLNGRPYVFSFILMYCAHIIALAANPLSAVIVMWAVLYATLRELGFSKTDKYSTLMVIGIFWAGISGQANIPFTGSTLALVGAFRRITELDIAYVPFIIYGLIVGVLINVLFVLIMKYIFRPDVDKLVKVNIEMFNRNPLPPMDIKQKISFTTLFTFMTLLMLPTFFERGTVPVIDMLASLGVHGIAMIHVAILLLIHIDGKPILNLPIILSKYVAWPVFFLVALAQPVAGAIVQPEMGILATITVVFEPILGGHSAGVFSGMMIVITMIITQLTNNVVIGTLMMPLIYVFGTPLDIYIPALTTAMIYTVHVAILLPAASAFAPLLWGNREWVSPKDIIKYAGLVTIFTTIMMAVIGVPLANFIFSLF